MSLVDKMMNSRYRLQVIRIINTAGLVLIPMIAVSPLVTYFVGNAIMHKEFSLGTFLLIVFGGWFLLFLFVPIFVGLLLLCEMYAEYLACLLFPRRK